MNRAADRLELVADPVRRTGRTLLSAGVEQSYVDVSDPRHLHFEYVRRIASAVEVAAPAGVPLSVLHLGGGALTLPRWLAATRPGSPQQVVERDPAVVELVARELPPLPPQVRVEVADARDALTATPAGSYDLVIADIYRAAQMPRHVRTVEFAADVARTLRPGGTYLVNVTDLPPLVGTRRRWPRCGRSSPTCASSATGGCCGAGGTETWCWPRRRAPEVCRSGGWRWRPCVTRCPAVCCTPPRSTPSSPAPTPSPTTTAEHLRPAGSRLDQNTPVAPTMPGFRRRARGRRGG